MVRLRSRTRPPSPTSNDRVAEGHSRRNAIRCLKRFVAREVYLDIQAITASHTPTTRTRDRRLTPRGAFSSGAAPIALIGRAFHVTFVHSSQNALGPI